MTNRWRLQVLLAVSLLAAASTVGCSGSGADDGAEQVETEALEAGHARMLEVIAAVHRRSGPENRFLGDSHLSFLQARMRSLPESAPPEQRCSLLLEVGRDELRLGRLESALEHFAEAEALLPQIADAHRAALELAVHYQLGLGSLRLGESRNCVNCTNGYGCLFPIQAAGIHTDPEGSTRAVESFGRVLRHPAAGEKQKLAARWLMNIASMTLGEHPAGVPAEDLIPESAFDSGQDFPRFRQAATERGLDSLNHCGAGVADDLDGDGDLDIMTSGYELDGQIRLFIGDGKGQFVERAVESGLEGFPGGLNMVQADYDNDGDLDVYVLRGAWLNQHGKYPNSLLQNDGKGSFRDVTFLAGLGEAHFPTQAADWGDYDNDGFLDLYVGNENFPSQLFHNQGDGTFKDVAAAAGVENNRYAKAVSFGDYDGDRHPDLYVSVEFGKNRLYHNEGDGTFKDVAPEAGVALPLLSFPTWFWDFDNDGHLDLFVCSYINDVAQVAASSLGLPHGGELSRLYRGDGEGGFENVAVSMGLTRLDAAMGANFGDLDNDGWLDFYLGTGWPGYDALFPNAMYRNQGGEAFVDVTTAGGFGHLQKGHAIAFADFDGDGDQDIFSQMGGAYGGDSFNDAYYENPGFGHHWIAVELEGVRSNRKGVGARIRVDIVDAGVERSIYRHVNSGGSFGANPLRQHIGLGEANRVERIEIYWPTSDLTQTIDDLEVDRVHTIREGE